MKESDDMKTGLKYNKIICLLIALALTAVYSVPIMPEAVWAEEKPETQNWGDEITKMLKAGGYGRRPYCGCGERLCCGLQQS